MLSPQVRAITTIDEEFLTRKQFPTLSGVMSPRTERRTTRGTASAESEHTNKSTSRRNVSYVPCFCFLHWACGWSSGLEGKSGGRGLIIILYHKPYGNMVGRSCCSRQDATNVLAPGSKISVQCCRGGTYPNLALSPIPRHEHWRVMYGCVMYHTLALAGPFSRHRPPAHPFPAAADGNFGVKMTTSLFSYYHPCVCVCVFMCDDDRGIVTLATLSGRTTS